ncbi:toprim domain-containing protein [Patescibacteria group bacterium]|nr:toprim domain-containing protein [Patescibacteria group bacterium]MBU4115989.1 toprim domain-containing protein [Patescibacteria group bacterium]
MNAIEKTTKIFSKFPGIGPRQSKRFVFFLLTKGNDFLDEFIELLNKLKNEISMCNSCYRFFPTNSKEKKTCNTCSDKNRNSSIIMLVEKDTDLENLEKSGVYKGYYFVLGGNISIFEKNPEEKIRAKELIKKINESIKNGLKEIIIATSLNTEGENTMEFVNKILAPIVKKYSLKVSVLGRGLSTGTELEYVDTETIKNALQNRQ